MSLRAYSEHAVLAEVHRIHAAMGFDTQRPPFSTTETIDKLFHEIEVRGEPMSKHAVIETYRKPLHDGIQAVIVYNSDDHHSTQRFSIMHEVAHWVFDCARGDAVPDEPACDPDGHSMQERRANFFAGEFVMPLWRLDSFVSFEIYPNRDDTDAVAARDQAIQKLAARFNVSMYCAKRRVFDLHAWRKIAR